MTAAHTLEMRGSIRPRVPLSIAGRFLLVLLLVWGVVVAGAVVAHAAPPATRPDSPGSGYHWGARVNLAGMPADTSKPEAGGWSMPVRQVSRYNVNVLPGSALIGRTQTPVSSIVMDPYVTGSGSSTILNLRLWAEWTHHYPPLSSYSTSAGTVLVHADLSGDISTALKSTAADEYESGWFAYCSPNRWSTPSQMTKYFVRPNTEAFSNMPQPADIVAASGGKLSYQVELGLRNVYKGGTNLSTGSTCTYLHRLGIVTAACDFGPKAQLGWDLVRDCRVTPMVWTAERWFQDDDYGLNDTDKVLCELDGATGSDCAWLTPGADPSELCNNPPRMDWLDWSWIPAAIGHYAKCLFIPIGWDRDGVIQEAWDENAPGQVMTAFESMVAAFSAPPPCGPLVEGDVDALGPISINTCDWAYAAEVRQLLVVVFYIASVVSLLVWIIATMMGAFGAAPLRFYLGMSDLEAELEAKK